MCCHSLSLRLVSALYVLSLFVTQVGVIIVCVVTFCHLRLVSPLGEGQFGTVSQGVWQTKDGEALSVAVKVLRSTAKLENRLKFLQEAAIMGQFLHPNIVRLYGVVLRDDPVRQPAAVLV